MFPEDLEKKIDAYLARQLPDEEMDAFEQAYFEDDALFEEVKLRAELSEVLDKHITEISPGHAHSQERGSALPMVADIARNGRGKFSIDEYPVKRQWIWAGAATAMLIALVLFKIAIPVGEPAESDAAIFTAELAEMYGDNFVESAQLEGRIENSELRGNTPIEVNSPGQGAILKDKIEFNWTTPGGGQPYQNDLSLIVFNNVGALIGASRVSGNQYRLEQALDPGLYYWLLETVNDGETLFAGKFYVLP